MKQQSKDIWSEQSSPDFEAEQLKFRLSMLDWLGIAVGHKVLDQQFAVAPSSKNVIYDENSNGILCTWNGTRKTKSASIIISGQCESVVFGMGFCPVKEDHKILWQAVKRDLEHEATRVSFYKVAPVFLTTQNSYFKGQQLQQTGTDIKIGQLLELIRTLQNQNGKFLLLACGDDSKYFVHISEGKIVGVVAVILALKNERVGERAREKIGYSVDLTMLNFELHDSSDFYVETYTQT